MANPEIDLSFARYVAARKGEASARSREGAAYAYAGDIKVRAALDRIRPVTLAVEATVRLWQSVEKSRMLGTSVKVTGKQFPHIMKLAERCADALRIPVPTVYVSPNIGSLNAHTFGTADDPYIVISAALIDHLSEAELMDVIGHECGHIQNSHVVYMTTLHFLRHAANAFLRWSVKPAVLALNGWARRAEVTCDRAGPDLHARRRGVDRLPGQAGARVERSSTARSTSRSTWRSSTRRRAASGGWTS